MRLLACRENISYVLLNYPAPPSKGNWKAPKVKEGFEYFFCGLEVISLRLIALIISKYTEASILFPHISINH